MATEILKRFDGRAQYLTFTLAGVKVTAARYRLTDKRFCPWLVVSGENVLPDNAQARGRMLTRLYAA